MFEKGRLGLGTVQFGLPYGISNTNGQTALMIAMQSSDYETIVRLIHHGATDNIMDNEGRNALDYYVENYNRIHAEHFIQGFDNQYIIDNLDPFNTIIILPDLNHLINIQILNNQDNNNHDDDNEDDDNEDDDNEDDDNQDDDNQDVDNEIIINQNPDLIIL